MFLHSNMATNKEIKAIIIHSTLKGLTETKSHLDRKHAGRPKKTSQFEIRYTLLLSSQNCLKNAPEIRREVNNTLTKKISKTTIIFCLKVKK